MYAASRAESMWVVALIVLPFSFCILTIYSLIHECEHGLFHTDRRINEVAGILLSVFFPGSFSFLRYCHVGHHSRNRSECELFELYYPHENRLKKAVFFYFLYLGGFWFSVPFASVVLLVLPWFSRTWLVQRSVSASAMINGIPLRALTTIRLEGLFVIAAHAALIYFLDLNPARYAILMLAQGVNWSCQQFLPHAHSPLDVIDGAYNLKVHRFYQALLLNFNLHLAHHQHPRVPWNYLDRFDDPGRRRPGYFEAFARFWRGPQPISEFQAEVGVRRDSSVIRPSSM